MEEEEKSGLWHTVCKFFSWLISDDAIPYVDVMFFIASCAGIFLTMETCQICVFGLLLVSMLFCCRFKYMFFILWACIGVLWLHGWRFGGGRGLSVQWN